MATKRIVILFALALALAQAGPALAQGDPLNPSGAIPWPIPQWPILASPTPYPLRPSPTPLTVTVTPTVTTTPTVTPTITPTIGAYNEQHQAIATMVYDLDQSLDQVDYAGAEIEGMTLDDLPDRLGGYARYFFAYAKGIRLFPLKPLGGVFTFTVMALVFIMLVKLSTVVLPMAISFYRFIVSMIRLVADFLPFIGALALIMALALAQAGPALAQGDATATPTPHPFPTATDWARPTPTLIAIVDPHHADPLDFDLSSVARMSDSIIQWYNFINLTGFVDTMIWLLLMSFLFAMLWRLAKKWQKI